MIYLYIFMYFANFFSSSPFFLMSRYYHYYNDMLHSRLSLLSARILRILCHFVHDMHNLLLCMGTVCEDFRDQARTIGPLHTYLN